jgi:hypothetical protein
MWTPTADQPLVQSVVGRLPPLALAVGACRAKRVIVPPLAEAVGGHLPPFAVAVGPYHLFKRR